ncbi:hypothetical protein QBC34DRAFT_429079 [Podospora aff. communis PSN243]|uniref:F-box domain-containing protein n=1 Tax=Podospora aff. communis PSN243 TaxID=3040156 RepID=A0AAV9GD39_9PEZI|nr:hypothetical protein QBC34DRAFT_429079 [Podospora aff. communis PSN243]
MHDRVPPSSRRATQDMNSTTQDMDSPVQAPKGPPILRLPMEVLIQIAWEVLDMSERWGKDMPATQATNHALQLTGIWMEMPRPKVMPAEQPILEFRLASRALSAAASEVLGMTWFRHRDVALNQDSLEGMLAISRHPTFGPKVETLTVRLDRLPEFGHEYIPIHLAEENDKQDTLMTSWQGVTYLSQIVANLPNLKLIEINDELEFLNGGRDRPAWGLGELRSKIDPHIVDHDFKQHKLQDRDFVKLLTRIVLSTISMSNYKEDFAIRIGKAAGFGYDSVTPMELEPTAEVIRYLEHKRPQTKSVTLQLAPDYSVRPVRPVTPLGGIKVWCKHLVGFLNIFSAIRELNLSFCHPKSWEKNHVTPHIECLCDCVHLPHLEKLSLGRFHCYRIRDFLLRLVDKHRATLRHLEFRSVTNWAGEGWAGIGDWEGFLCEIRQKSDVTSVLMFDCSQVYAPLNFGDKHLPFVDLRSQWSRAPPRVLEFVWHFGDDGRYVHTVDDIVDIMRA